MLHGLHGAGFRRLRQKQEAVQLRFLPREPDILLPDAKERNVLLQAHSRIPVVYADRGGANGCPHALHGAEGGKDGLRGCSKLVRQRLCGKSVSPP